MWLAGAIPPLSIGGPARQFIKPANVSWKVFCLTGATVPNMSSWSHALPAVLAAALLFAVAMGIGAVSPALAGESPDHQVVDEDPPLDATGTPAENVVSASLSDDPLDTNTTITIRLAADGTAYWQINATYPLTSDSERDGFDQVASTFEADDDQDLGLSAYEVAAERVDEEVDRTMSIGNVEQYSTVEEHNESANATGVLTVEFEWTEFARTDGNELHIDDVLLAGEERWFPGLAGDQRLVIELPEEYGVRSASVSPQNGALVWEGPADFTDGALESIFVGDRNGDPLPPNGTETSLMPWVLIVVAIAIASGFAYLARDNLRTLIEGAKEPVTESETTQAPPSPPSDPEEGAAESTEDETDEDAAEAELLSDEERVEYLLEQNGGRMKQADIVKETDWSNAKVSQLLSGMHEDGRIDKLRIGRENLISFPDETLLPEDENQ